MQHYQQPKQQQAGCSDSTISSTVDVLPCAPPDDEGTNSIDGSEALAMEQQLLPDEKSEIEGAAIACEFVAQGVTPLAPPCLQARGLADTPHPVALTTTTTTTTTTTPEQPGFPAQVNVASLLSTKRGRSAINRRCVRDNGCVDVEKLARTREIARKSYWRRRQSDLKTKEKLQQRLARLTAETAVLETERTSLLRLRNDLYCRVIAIPGMISTM